MLNVHQLNKNIGGKQVLRDITFSLEKGTIAGLIGRNGIGKTTLLRTIAGILDPDEGEVVLNHMDVHQNPEVKQHMVYVADSTKLLNSYSIKEIVKLYGSAYITFDHDCFYKLLTRFNLPSDKRIRNFSKGMKALLAIILAFSVRAELIILDEPTNGLDPIIKRQILQFIIEEVSEHATTVLISTHHLDEIEKMADMLIMIKDGELESVTSIDDTKERYMKVQAVFEKQYPERLQLLSNLQVVNQIGRVYTLLIDGKIDQTLAKIEQERPVLLEELPMTLEDIFVTALGGESHVS